MSASDRNMLRVRAIWLGRAARELFRPDPAGGAWIPPIVARVLGALALWPLLHRWAYRAVFTVDGRALRRAGEWVLADLRDFAFARAGRVMFDSDPLELARRAGRREMFDRMTYFLNLDENQVQTLMEIEYE